MYSNLPDAGTHLFHGLPIRWLQATLNTPPVTPYQGLDHFGLAVSGIDAIAAELGLSPKTIEDHRAQISAKTGTSGLAQLIELAGDPERAHA